MLATQDSAGKSPTVSIGLFVYNAAPHLRAALDSMLSQTWTDFELIVGDNASTDGTEAICREYAARDARIRYFRHPENTGPCANLRFVLGEARGKYFMWAAGDDVKSVDFLQANLTALENDDSLVASTSPNCFAGEELEYDKHVTFELRGTLFERLMTLLRNCWASHGIFYALIRREALLDCHAIDDYFVAFDWSVDAHLATRGEVARVKAGLMVSGRSGISNQADHYRRHTRNRAERMVPLYEFTRRLIRSTLKSRELTAREKMMLLVRLAKLNIDTGVSLAGRSFSTEH